MTPPTRPGDDLYSNWLVWVRANLGDDPKYGPVAATAATDVAAEGKGFNAAALAATYAWIEAAQDEKPLWRPGFWSLLITETYFWVLVGLLVSIPLYWVAPGLSVLAVLIPFALIGVGWKAYVFFRLSRRGIVVPGSLINVKVMDSDGALHRSTYQFNFHGRHFTSRLSRETTPDVVLVLFDPAHPNVAMVMPELLNPAAWRSLATNPGWAQSS
jgi:hypothetical protein